MSTSTADALPDEVLAVILKLVADSPVLDSSTPPFPVAAECVNQRWRTVVRGCPELWTNIRLSHRARSWKWALGFVLRSQSQPLDISINLESYFYRRGRACHCNFLPLCWALRILGPHIGRWRTVSLRGHLPDVAEFCEFLEGSPRAASRLQSVHFSVIGLDMMYIDLHDLSSSWLELTLPSLAGCASLRSLRINRAFRLVDFAAFSSLQSLDIDASQTRGIRSEECRQLFERASALSTLVLRNFSPDEYPPSHDSPIQASTIKSLAVGFSTRSSYWAECTTLTSCFSFPNLEYLEIIGDFAFDYLPAPNSWDPPLFPHLHTLRLEDVDFSRTSLAFIHDFSYEITALQLVNTTWNDALLTPYPDAEFEVWPALQTLTVETQLNERVAPAWLVSFVTMRAVYVPITELVIPVWPTDLLSSIDPSPHVRFLDEGLSHGLMDGYPGHGFYLDKYDMRAVDFEDMPRPQSYYCPCGYEPRRDDNFLMYHGPDVELLEREIEEEFKLEGEVVRTKGTCRERKRERRRDMRIGQKAKAKRSSKHRRFALREDLWVV